MFIKGLAGLMVHSRRRHRNHRVIAGGDDVFDEHMELHSELELIGMEEIKALFGTSVKTTLGSHI